MVEVFLDLSISAMAMTMAFAIGLVWAFVCQGVRWWITTRVEEALTPLEKWVKSDLVASDMPDNIRRFAYRWPTVLWVKICDSIGLLDLSAGDAYETYRAKATWNNRFRERKEVMGGSDRLFSWLTKKERLIAIVASVGTIVYVVSIASYVLSSESHLLWPLAMPPYAYLMQAVVILLFFVLTPAPLVADSEHRDVAEAARSFWRYWCLWEASWIVLYMLLWSAEIGPQVPILGFAKQREDKLNPIWEVAIHLANNVNSLLLVLCYCVLYAPSGIRIKSKPLVRDVLTFGSVIVLVLTTVELVCYRFEWLSAISIVYWIGNVGGGVGLAMLVGRLESKLIGPPIVFIVILYFYAVTQGTMGGAGRNSVVEQTSFIAALPLKCVLLILVGWIIGTDKLSSYMKEVLNLDGQPENN